MLIVLKSVIKKMKPWDFPGGPVVTTLCFHGRMLLLNTQHMCRMKLNNLPYYIFN